MVGDYDKSLNFFKDFDRRDKIGTIRKRSLEDLERLGAKPLSETEFADYYFIDRENGKREIYEPTGEGTYSLRRVVDII